MGNEKGFVVEVDGEVVGGIQYSEEDDPIYSHANIDVFLAVPRHNIYVTQRDYRLSPAPGEASPFSCWERGASPVDLFVDRKTQNAIGGVAVTDLEKDG